MVLCFMNQCEISQRKAQRSLGFSECACPRAQQCGTADRVSKTSSALADGNVAVPEDGHTPELEVAAEARAHSGELRTCQFAVVLFPF